jgi:SAM-dependent MidA family methyltransferase
MKMPTDAIREEIRQTGAIPFARFMELALYCPETGYYESQKDTVGRHGDFITSVSAGSLFGELLAFQFAEWLAEFQISNLKSQIIEAGAHDGKLAADILSWLQTHRPRLFSAIEYVILEPSLNRQAWQKETLKPFAPRVRWFTDFENLKLKTQNSKLHGVLFSNELLDAFPVHRYGWDATTKQWFEWGVALADEKFIWTKITGSLAPSDGERVGVRGFDPSSIFHLPSSLLEVLPDNYTIEVSPAAENWWCTAAGILSRGRLLTIDYGFTADELFSPARPRGTLRAYHRHRVSDDLLAHAGEQDLTAHVNFSAIQQAGEEAGLKTENFCTQPQFLTRILQKAVAEKSFARLDAKQVRQFQTLTHPEHLGRAFRVLVQSKG